MKIAAAMETLEETLTERLNHFIKLKESYQRQQETRKVREMEQRIELLQTLLDKEKTG